MAATSRPTRRSRAGRARWVALGAGALAASSARAQSELEFKYLLYKESGERTEVQNPWIRLDQNFGKKAGRLSLLLGYDTISGASPTGGYPTQDATTSASGATSSSIPLAEYQDTRKSVTASYARAFGAHLPSIDLSYGKENDYLARAVGLSDAWTTAGGRGTLHFGLSISRDLVTPVTTGLAHDKKTNAYALGWSWIASERDIVDVSASLSRLNGYLDDPYKIVTVGTETLPEHRPADRARYATLVKYGHFFPGARAALKLIYRYYWDDWSVGAHTLETSYEQHAGSRWIVSPSLRLYTQSSAVFYASRFAAPATYMSADYRLSPFDSALAGLTLSYAIRPSLVVSLGATYQRQQGRDRVVPTPAVPALRAPGEDGDGDGDEDDEGGGGTVSAADLTVMTGTLGLSWRY